MAETYDDDEYLEWYHPDTYDGTPSKAGTPCIALSSYTRSGDKMIWVYSEGANSLHPRSEGWIPLKEMFELPIRQP